MSPLSSVSHINFVVVHVIDKETLVITFNAYYYCSIVSDKLVPIHSVILLLLRILCSYISNLSVTVLQ